MWLFALWKGCPFARDTAPRKEVANLHRERPTYDPVGNSCLEIIVALEALNRLVAHQCGSGPGITMNFLLSPATWAFQRNHNVSLSGHGWVSTAASYHARRTALTRGPHAGIWRFVVPLHRAPFFCGINEDTPAFQPSFVHRTIFQFPETRHPLLCHCGVEPETSTGPITQAFWERMRWSERKLQGEILRKHV
jgi:hypothetical protein